MNKADFNYDLPQELIAYEPCDERTASRLLCLDGMQITHKHFYDLPDLLREGDLLVFNNSKVIPARLYGSRATGGKVEMLIERVLQNGTALAHIKSNKTPKDGSIITLDNDTDITVTGRADALFKVQLNSNDSDWLQLMEDIGHIPLPPYIDRADENFDKDRYQTVYAEPEGSVAAPTAGLHFDDALLDTLKSKNIETAFVTLHVGAGTFKPVKTDDIADHVMHSEYLEVSDDTCQKVNAARRAGRRIIAVGTTSVRCLETAHNGTELEPYKGETDIFIYPGYKFKCVDALITNFHLPESTLLMLVSAFSGYTPIMNAYQKAIVEKYRFFSYGDAMFLSRNDEADAP